MSANKGKFSNETVGSDYWISYTDIMTGLLLIFIILIVSLVLYLCIAGRLAQDKTNQLKTLEQQQKALQAEKVKLEREKQRILKEVDAAIARHQRNVWEIMEQIKQQLDKAHVQVDIDYKNYVIHINNSTLGFEKGKFNIEQPVYKNNVAKISQAFYSTLKNRVSREKLQSIETIFIEGHTDADPYFNPQMKGNWGLSTMRAIEFWEKFVGVDYNKQAEYALNCKTDDLSCYFLTMQNQYGKKMFSVSGYADTRPVTYEKDNDYKNRRIDIKFVYKAATKEEFQKVLYEDVGK